MIALYLGDRNVGRRIRALTRDAVTVAVHGPVYGYPGLPVFDGPGFEDQSPDIPYAERVRVEVEVTEITPLGEIIDTAAARLGTTHPHGGRVCDALTGVVFYEPEDEVSFKWREEPWPRVIRLADETGLPSWGVLWTEIRFGELLAASDAQLIIGDPRRPYFWPVIPQGDGLQGLPHFALPSLECLGACACRLWDVRPCTSHS